MRIRTLTALILTAAILISGCAGAAPSPAPTASAAPQETETPRPSYDIPVGAHRIRLGDSIELSEPDAAALDGHTLTISRAGAYVIDGHFTNSSIIIDAPPTAEVQLILNGAEIYRLDTAAIFARQAGRVYITLAEGTKNRLSNGGSFDNADIPEADAVLGSVPELVITGGGSLEISSPVASGISADSRLTMDGGTLTISAASNAIRAKELFAVSGGAINIDSAYGVVCPNICVLGGEHSIRAKNDALSATDLRENGNYSDYRVDISGGRLFLDATGCGIYSGGTLSVSGGETIIAAARAALNYAFTGEISGGTVAAFGSAHYAQNFSSGTQGAILAATGEQSAGAQVVLTDESGQEVICLESAKYFSSVVISSPNIKEGESYTLKVGDYEEQIKMDSLIYFSTSMDGLDPDPNGIKNHPVPHIAAQ